MVMNKGVDDKIAWFDMDGVIADYDSAMIRDLTRLGVQNIPGDFYVKEFERVYGEHMRLIKNQHGWWRGLSPIQSGFEIMGVCRDIGFEIGILTQAPRNMPQAWGEKYEWCEEHVKPITKDYFTMITRKGKGFVYGRVLVDDYPPFTGSGA